MRPQSASVLLRGPPLNLGDIMKQGYLQRVRDLVDLGLNVDSRDGEGKTPLMLCGLLEPEEWGIGIARLLIENGANLRLRDKTGLNALHHACIYERYGLTKVFLSAIDFDLNQQDKYGNTALHYTVRSGNIDMITLLVAFLRKYGMRLDKINKAGLTALDLAYTHSSECILLLKPPRPASTASEEEEREKEDTENEKGDIPDTDEETGHLSLTESNLKSFFDGTQHERQIQRPKTALLKRRRASSCSSTSSLSSGGRSRSKISAKSSPRLRDQQAQPNVKDVGRIIRCVSLSDFRNTKEYVFKLTAIPYDELDGERGLPSIGRSQTSWTPRPEPVYQSSEAEPFSWRTEFKKLYVDYEFQCTPSWRETAKSITDQIVLPPSPPPEEEEEKLIRDRRGSRRASTTSNKSLNVESLKDKRRPSGNIKPRKMSTTSTIGLTPHSKPSIADTVLGSSSESLTSSSSSKKKDLVNKAETGGKTAAQTTDKDPSKNVSSSLQIPAVTETLVGDNDGNETVTDDASQLDSNRLSVLSDIDEDN